MKKEEKNVMIDVNMLDFDLKSIDHKLKVSSLSLEYNVNVIDGDTDNTYSQGVSPIVIIHNLPREISEENTPEGVGAVRISNRSRDKLLHEAGNYYSNMQQAYLKALPHIVDMVKNSVLLEEHRDRKKNANGKRFPENESDINIDKVQRLYGAIKINNYLYRTKTTIQIYQENINEGKYHGYDITEIELLGPKPRTIDISPEGDVALPNNSSISIAKLIENVELSYESGVKLSDAMTKARRLVKEIKVKQKKSKGFRR